jgi:hypothetical protein
MTRLPVLLLQQGLDYWRLQLQQLRPPCEQPSPLRHATTTPRKQPQ